jgi:hypothetical protein
MVGPDSDSVKPDPQAFVPVKIIRLFAASVPDPYPDT